MFGPSSPWPPCSCSPSSVTQWLLYRTVLITVLFGVASSKDWRKDLQSDFTGHVQTIGPLDGRLWAITTEWTVHEMTPCDKGNETLSLCMEIGFPVQLDKKWPELAKSVKENANVTDFNFAVDNSVFMNSTDNVTVLIMQGISFKPQNSFGFNFTANSSIKDYVTVEQNIVKALWISSDEKDKAYALDSHKKLQYILLADMRNHWLISVFSSKSICKVNDESSLSLRIADKCDQGEMDWTVLKAVRYGGQFYFFTKDKVYIFASVENVDSKVYTTSYDKFIHCKEPTTTRPPSTHLMVTTSKGSNMTVIIVVVVGLVLLVIILIILAFVCCKKPSKSSQKSSASPGKKTKVNNKVSSQKAGPSTKQESQAGSSKNFAIDSKANKKPQVSAAKGSSAASAQGKHSKSRAK